jgi:hypothetical protein
MNCHFSGRRVAPDGVACDGPAVAIAHDWRGCRLVCGAHASWLETTSQVFGHSPECTERELKTWQRITKLDTSR